MHHYYQVPTFVMFHFHLTDCWLHLHKSLCWHSPMRGFWAYPRLDSKVHGANMGPTWVLSAPDGRIVGPMNFAIRDVAILYLPLCFILFECSDLLKSSHICTCLEDSILYLIHPCVACAKFWPNLAYVLIFHARVRHFVFYEMGLNITSQFFVCPTACMSF